MNDTSTTDTGSSAGTPTSLQRLYVLREQDLWQPVSDRMSFLDLWHLLWREKVLVASVTAAAIVLSLTYGLTATKWYQGEVVLSPREDTADQALSGALGGIANIVGMNIGAGSANSVDSFAVLQSWDFIGQFITDQNLVPVLFADLWNPKTQRWDVTDPDAQPDVRTATKYFLTNVMSVQTDRETKLVTLDIDWKDPVLAASWANMLVERLNQRMRERAIAEAQANVDYLQAELGKAGVVTMQLAIGKVLETEMQKLMLARGREEFAYRIIDHARVPRERLRPRRALIVAASTFLGGMLAVFLALIRNALRSARNAGARP